MPRTPSLPASLIVLLALTACSTKPGVRERADAPAAAPERRERMDAALGADATPLDDPRTQVGGRRLPGRQADGAVLLHNQWSLRPAGNQLELGDFPVNMAVHPLKPIAAILHAGHGTHEVVTVDLNDRQIIGRATVPQTFYGVCFDRAGTRVFCSGAERELVYTFALGKNGELGERTQTSVAPRESTFVPAGMTTSNDDRTLFVCGAWGHKLAALSIDGSANPPRLLDLPAESFPYAPLLSSDGGTLFVSLWGKSGIAVVDPATMTLRGVWPTPSHPTEMVLTHDGSSLLVACANSNSVAVLDTATGQTRELINIALHPSAPPGSSPNALSLSPDGKTLYVASADNNCVAVVDVSEPGRSRPRGFIPTGWYPTSVRALGEYVWTLSARGLSPKSNRHGPQPGVPIAGGVREYIGGLYRGSLARVKVPDDEALARFSAQAVASSPLRGDTQPVLVPEEGNPVPARVGDASPITHCIYVIKENRTYDQVFGAMEKGNGDPTLCIFGEDVTPNKHALAREFVLLDNFYVNAEVSASGHEWTMGAFSTDFVNKVWPLTYRQQPDPRKLTYPAEGAFDIATPAGGYLFNRCIEAGVSFRTYGEWVRKGEKPGDPFLPNDPALEGRFDPGYMPYDLDYPDVRRAERFISELKRFESEGQMPRMQVVRLGNDHTAGTRAGKPTPRAMVADNDLALGMVVEAVSRSKFWPTTAIFVLEDDAQNGPDHVDAHRSPALVISPYVKRGSLDSTMYSTVSVLRTMGLILGLKPMSQYDAGAAPMYACFGPTPDTRPFTARPARVDLNEKNAANAAFADLSETLDLAEADAADDLVLNRVVWASVRGPGVPMPPPVRAGFVFPMGDGDDDD